MAAISTTVDAISPDAINSHNQWPYPYFYSDGLRRVAPYHFTYKTFCKERWRGREILEIFASEFRDRTREYYKRAIETEQIAINGTPCKDVHTVVKNGDLLSHTLHRHEPPVTAQPIRVIEETDTLIVIDKPAGVPVHPAGRYSHNSIVEIMRAERKAAFNPLPCNRLDRLSSGVMFVGKEKKEAERICEKLRSRTMRKEYVARVKGRFPDGEGEVKGDLGGVVRCEENILQISPILGLNRARASGKTAKTLFRRIAYYPPESNLQSVNRETPRDPDSTHSIPAFSDCKPDQQPPIAPAAPAAPFPAAKSSDGYSIVHCLPLTGRTHQIRVHLQFLGHPITNDPIYANRRVFGSKLAVHDSSAAQDEEIMRQLAKMGKTEVADAIDYDNQNYNSRMQQVDGIKETAELEQTMQTCAAPPPRDCTSNTTTTTTPDADNQPGPDPSTQETQDRLPFSTPEEYSSFVAQHDAMVSDYNKRRGEKRTGETCPVCLTDLYSDPGPHELGIYLHALAYSDGQGELEARSPVPAWALPRPAPGFGFGAGAGSGRGRGLETGQRGTEAQGGESEREREREKERQKETETREILARGWVYDGSEVPPVEIDRQALNRQGLKRNKKQNAN